jgi:hypothetical protein
MEVFSLAQRSTCCVYASLRFNVLNYAQCVFLEKSSTPRLLNYPEPQHDEASVVACFDFEMLCTGSCGSVHAVLKFSER